jgi:hypothetical protein
MALGPFVPLSMALGTMTEFLTSVDVPARDEDFIKKVVNILAAEGLELTEPLDLDGLAVDVIVKALPGSVTSKTSSFICRAIRKATTKGASMVVAPVTPGGLGPAASATPLGFSAISGAAATQEQNYDMAEFFAKKKLAARKVHVMLAPLLSKINVNNLAESAWPQGFAMNAAATEASRRSSLLVDAGSTVLDEPFVCVDLRNFEPLWCKANEVQDDEADDDCKVKAKKQRQQTPRWNVAFDKWALFAAARGHLSFGKCLEHKEICQRIAFRAMLGSKPRKAVLGVIYDEMARTKWAARCMQDTGFRADDVAGCLDEEVLREAEVCFDYENKQQQPKGDGKGHAAATTCYNCGKPGHMSYECYGKGKGAAKGGKGKPIVCYKCGEEGHKSTECGKQGLKRKHP